jgi:hypothetical protein
MEYDNKHELQEYALNIFRKYKWSKLILKKYP